jgi:hypothetical protein
VVPSAIGVEGTTGALVGGASLAGVGDVFGSIVPFGSELALGAGGIAG